MTTITIIMEFKSFVKENAEYIRFLFDRIEQKGIGKMKYFSEIEIDSNKTTYEELMFNRNICIHATEDTSSVLACLLRALIDKNKNVLVIDDDCDSDDETKKIEKKKFRELFDRLSEEHDLSEYEKSKWFNPAVYTAENVRELYEKYF